MNPTCLVMTTSTEYVNDEGRVKTLERDGWTVVHMEPGPDDWWIIEMELI